jgi:hypothetical protein
MSSSAPRGARTSTSTAWSRSVRPAMPKPMPATRGAGLVITPLGEGRFTVEVTRGADKWAIARSSGPSMARALGDHEVEELRVHYRATIPELTARHVIVDLLAGCADERGMVGHPAAGLAANPAALLGTRVSGRRGGLSGSLPQQSLSPPASLAMSPGFPARSSSPCFSSDAVGNGGHLPHYHDVQRGSISRRLPSL